MGKKRDAALRRAMLVGVKFVRGNRASWRRGPTLCVSFNLLNAVKFGPRGEEDYQDMWGFTWSYWKNGGHRNE